MKLIAIEPLKCGGKRLAPGDTFDAATKEVAEALIAAGAARAAGATPAAKPARRSGGAAGAESEGGEP